MDKTAPRIIENRITWRDNRTHQYGLGRKPSAFHALTSFLSRIGARKVAKQMPRVVDVGKRLVYVPTVPPVSSSAALVAFSTDPSSSALMTFMVLRRWSSSASAAASASR
jgi:hypothetical protein